MVILKESLTKTRKKKVNLVVASFEDEHSANIHTRHWTESIDILKGSRQSLPTKNLSSVWEKDENRDNHQKRVRG